ncbi:hypothetical protein J6A31_00860 [bacterium]|nr:hypothetical protein [bacterium]
MNINSINTNQQRNLSFQKGLYFVDSPSVVFDKNKKVESFLRHVFWKNSDDGFLYVENKSVPQKVKSAISNDSFVKDLAEKFDTFVYVRKPFKCPDFDNYCSHMKIKWFDSSKNTVETRDVVGLSQESKKTALTTMLDKLKIKEFF